MSAPPLLVLHDVGAREGGAPWRAAATSAGWPGAVHAPDLPGHAGAPPPVGGNYELADAVFSVLPLVSQLSDPTPVIVGVGRNGWAAQLLALGGRAQALVLVDGIGGPWLDAEATIRAGRDLLRAVASDPDALAPPPPDGLDPRLCHGVAGQTNRSMAARVFTALSVPLVVLESPASPLTAADRDDLVARCEPPATVIEVPDARPDTVAPHLPPNLRQ